MFYNCFTGLQTSLKKQIRKHRKKQWHWLFHIFSLSHLKLCRDFFNLYLCALSSYSFQNIKNIFYTNIVFIGSIIFVAHQCTIKHQTHSILKHTLTCTLLITSEFKETFVCTDSTVQYHRINMYTQCVINTDHVMRRDKSITLY